MRLAWSFRAPYWRVRTRPSEQSADYRFASVSALRVLLVLTDREGAGGGHMSDATRRLFALTRK